MLVTWKVLSLVRRSKNKPKRSEYYLVGNGIRITNCALIQNFFQRQSFINIFSKSKLWYNVVILTKVSPHLADILKNLKIVHSTIYWFKPLSLPCEIYKSQAKYKIFCNHLTATKVRICFRSHFYHKNYKITWFHVSLLANFDTCLVMPYTGGRRKHSIKSIESEPTNFNNWKVQSGSQ